MSVVSQDAVPAAGGALEVSKGRIPTLPLDPTTRVIVGFGSIAAFDLLQRVGRMFSESTIVPKDYKGNLGNCAIACEMAARLKLNPLMVMQNLKIIHGNPGWSGKFLIARFNEDGRFERIKYEWTGKRGSDDWGCRAYSKDKATGERIEGPLIDMVLVKAEGWFKREGSKWQSMPEKMFMYRAAAWMIDVAAPEVAMGIPTSDELEDAGNYGGPEAGAELGEGLMDANRVIANARPTPPHADEDGVMLASPEQLQLIRDRLSDHEIVEEDFVKELQLTKLEEVLFDNVPAVLKQIAEHK